MKEKVKEIIEKKKKDKAKKMKEKGDIINKQATKTPAKKE